MAEHHARVLSDLKWLTSRAPAARGGSWMTPGGPAPVRGREGGKEGGLLRSIRPAIWK